MKRWQSEVFEAAFQIGAWLDQFEQKVCELTVVWIGGSIQEGWLLVVSYWEEEEKQR